MGWTVHQGDFSGSQKAASLRFDRGGNGEELRKTLPHGQYPQVFFL
jgi:hypothetical protein